MFLAMLGTVAILIGCTSEKTAETSYPEPWFDGLGPHSRLVSTSNVDAQAFFNQGFAFLFAFNHDEAIRSFEQAVKIDSMCAMAYWGISYAHGPYINFPLMLPHKAAAAWDALQKAQRHAHHGSQVEQDLIKALSTRYANPEPANRASLDTAYSNAMRELWKKYPKDADIGVLFAESMMDLRPWDQWDYEGTAKPGTAEVIATLEAVMQLDPKHPLALHLYVHAMEASLTPGKATEAGDKLRNLTPAMGHMVHMPSHIDVRTGEWEKAVLANTKAITADSMYRTKAKVAPDFYNLYMAHNHHMLAYAGMMSGRSEQAIAAVDRYVREIPDSFAVNWAFIADGFMAGPFEVRIRFGKWNEILELPEPLEIHPLARAMRFHARAVAYSALGNPRSADVERKLFEEAVKKVPADAMFGNNMAADILAVARKHMEGEMAIHNHQTAKGLALLAEAVAAEDKLRYDEPPDWILPIRHTLGAALVNEKKYEEAEKVYREDLAKIPENGWSLYGLERSVRALGREDEADALEKRFKAVWKKGDLDITSSCMCLPAR